MKALVPTFLSITCLSGMAMCADPPQPADQIPPERVAPAPQRDRNDQSYFAQEQERPRGHDERVVLEKGAYLGVSARPAPPLLRRHLGLPAGMGLVVEFVADKTPASAAGIKPDDVLEKLNDQLLVNPEQLAVLVRSYKPGDEIKLSIVRDGQKQTLSIKLAEHDLEPLPLRDPFQPWDFEPPMLRHFPPFTPRHLAPMDGFQPRKNATSTVRWIDGDRTYTIITDDQGHQTASVKDRDERTVFEGPIDTKEQRDRLPTDIREKLDKMIRSGLLPNDAPPQPKTEDRR